MRITPLDVRKQEFRKVVRGLDAEEVYAFLATVAEEYEVVLTDNKQLREQMVSLDEKVREYRNMETTLRDTLMTAERVNNESRQNAEKEASLIVERAKVEAQRETASISSRVEGLRSELRELKKQRDAFLTRLRTLSETQLNLLSNYEHDFDGDDRSAMESAAGRTPQLLASNPAPSGPVPPVQPNPAPPVAAPAPPVTGAQPIPPQPTNAYVPTATVPEEPVDDQPTRPIPTFAGVPMDPSEDDWRDYAVGSTAPMGAGPAAPAPAAPQPPVVTGVDELHAAEAELMDEIPFDREYVLDEAPELAQVVAEVSSEAGGQPSESVSTSAPADSETQESAQASQAAGVSTGGSGWSMQQFTRGLPD